MDTAQTAPVAAEPADGSELLGRDAELSQLSEVLARARLLTLTGAPGIGKSRLARALAGDGARDEIGLVELAPVSRPGDVARAVAAALSIGEVGGQELAETIAGRLADRPALIVLDNCEHLLAACAELAGRLLDRCPGVRVLATSREPLGLAAERVWRVPPLEVPGEAGASPDEIARSAAVALFVRRAKAVRPGFALNAYVAPAVAEIARRLDGIPLAIELAAARVESLTPEEIAGRLGDRFALLAEAATHLRGRHETLRAALDWSHDLLAGPERALLRRLSVFAGDFDAGAAAAVTRGAPVRPARVPELLEGLAAKSLIDPSGSREGRYRLLETIRIYAGERLEGAGERAATRSAHARHYLELAEAAEPELAGRRQDEWLRRLELERANVRAALDWSVAQGEPEQALRLAGALVLFWRVRCHFGEGRELLEAALSGADGASAALRARALWGLGFMTLMAGDADAAIQPLERSLAGFRALRDRSGTARALLIRGNARQQHRDDAATLALLEESVALAREAGDSWCLSHALGAAGLEHCYRHDLVAARPPLEESVAVAREAGDAQGLRFGLLGLGAVLVRQGDYRSAEPVLAEALAVSEQLGEDYSRATALGWLAQCAHERGDHARAGVLLDEVLMVIRRIRPSELVMPLVSRARVAHAQGERGPARELLGEALALARDGSPGLGAVLQARAELLVAPEEPGEARRMLERALDLARASDDPRAEAGALHALGALARTGGDERRAAALHSEALALQLRIGDRRGLARSVAAIGGAAAAGGDERGARLLGAVRAASLANDWVETSAVAAPVEEDLALARDRLGEDSLAAALAEGEALSLDDAARAAAARHRERGRPGAGGWSSLTDRERGVAALVGRGMTNPEIAESLVISRATVKRHVANIFAKLGLTSRAQLAREVWRRAGEEPASER